MVKLRRYFGNLTIIFLEYCSGKISEILTVSDEAFLLRSNWKSIASELNLSDKQVQKIKMEVSRAKSAPEESSPHYKDPVYWMLYKWTDEARKPVKLAYFVDVLQSMGYTKSSGIKTQTIDKYFIRISETSHF